MTQNFSEWKEKRVRKWFVRVSKVSLKRDIQRMTKLEVMQTLQRMVLDFMKDFISSIFIFLAFPLVWIEKAKVYFNRTFVLEKYFCQATEATFKHEGICFLFIFNRFRCEIVPSPLRELFMLVAAQKLKTQRLQEVTYLDEIFWKFESASQ